MDNKPVIILGGGLWGGLLAYRLSTVLPHLHFVLYEKGTALGGNHTWTFAESDLPAKAMKWLKPFIVKSWKGYDFHFPSHSRSFSNAYHSISSRRFHDVISGTLKPTNLKLNNEIPLEVAASEGSFIIDARNECHYKRKGYRKLLGIEVELEDPHGLSQPTLMDAKVEQKDGYRFMQYLPWDERSVLVEDTRYSSQPGMDLDEMRADIWNIFKAKGWKVKSVLREETQIVPIPMTPPIYRSEGKVVTLGGILHDTTGESLPEAIRLIDLMLASSFRLGEVKKIVRKFREEREKDRSFFRLINRFMFESASPEERYKVFQRFYQLPEPVVRRFYRGELQFWDRPRIFAGTPSLPKVSQFLTPLWMMIK